MQNNITAELNIIDRTATDFSKMTCYEMLQATCDKSASIYFEEHKLSMNRFLKHIDEFAISLVELGFKKGEVLTIYLPTCPQALVAFYACSKLGVIANIVHPLIPLEQLKENLKTTNSKGLMFYDILIKNHNKLNDCGQIQIKCSIADYVFFRKPVFRLYIKLKSITDSKQCLKYSDLVNFSKKHKSSIPQISYEATANDIVCTMHSGGTSGVPKIVELNNVAFNNLSVSLEKMYTRKNREHEYCLVALPIFHAYGLGVSVHTGITNGYGLILMPKFNPKGINANIKKHNVTMFAGVPIMFKKMMEQRNFYGKHLQKLRDLWCGGDVLTESFIEHFDTVLSKYKCPARLMRGYGLTEVASVCAVNTFENYKKNSCGKPIPGTQIEIWDEDEKRLKPNEIGEIAINSSSAMVSYIDNTGCVNKDGVKWIKTGDIGYMDKDGFLYVLDRKKRTIKINAINIFPTEIENLVKTINYIDEVCAIPYHYNRKSYIRLFITKKQTTINDDKIKKEITSLCTKKLIKYAVPREIRIIDEMPYTKLGKVDYKTLERM